MQISVLNELLLEEEIVESYESLIWTERWRSVGDFEIKIDPDIPDASLFRHGTRLSFSRSNRVMVVDTIDNSLDEDGRRLLTIKGPSLEAVLEDRANVALAKGDLPPAEVVLSNPPADIMRNLFDAICVSNTADVTDRLEFVQPAGSPPVSNIIAPPGTVTIRTIFESLYATLTKIAEAYDLGFRLVRDGVDLYFEVYTGNDRTSGQTDLPTVIFSPGLDTLTDVKQIVSTALVKNVAYVYSKADARVVYAPDIDVNIGGFSKKLLLVDATDLDLPAGTELDEALEQRGFEALSKQRIVIGFDGKIDETGPYIYGVDYELGDLVEQQDESGDKNYMRVTEQIFVKDKEGYREYPTLVLNDVVLAGTWYTLPAYKQWYDFTTEQWVDV